MDGAAALTCRPMQPALFDLPLAGLYPSDMAAANTLLVAWGHRLGPVHRPFTQQAWTFCVDQQPVAVAVSGSAVSATVGGYRRMEVVELTRLCSAPAANWATRIMLRLWRVVCARRWPDWDVRAAISYSKNADHKGDIYRFDGWERIKTDAGSGGGGAWSRQRYAGEAVYGAKSLWLWRYEDLA